MSMSLTEAIKVLSEHRHRGIQFWEATDYHSHVQGKSSSTGFSVVALTPFEAIAVATALQAANAANSKDLGPLEWRKQVDKQLEAVEFTRQCHNDRFHRDEKQLQDHDYRITAWGECLSDALKKIITQDERIAKLEARVSVAEDVNSDHADKLDEFEASETVEEVVGRIAKLEADVSRHDENIVYVGGRTAENGIKVYALKAQVANMEAKLGKFEATETVKEVVGRIAATEQRVAKIAKKVNELTDESVFVECLAF